MLALYVRVIVPASVTLPLISGVIRFRYLPKSYRLLFIYLLLSAFTNLLTILLSIWQVSNLYILHWYTVAELLLLAAFFREQFSGYPARQQVIVWGAILFFLACLLSLIFPDNSSRFDAYASSIEAILIDLMCIALIYLDSHSELVDSWQKRPVNWFNTGLLLYFSGSMFLFLFSNQLMQAPRSVVMLAWAVHATLLLFMYLLFTIGFFQCKKYRII